MEGFSDDLPKIGGFCRFPDPFSEPCVFHACIPGNQENATVSQPMGLVPADMAILFSLLREASTTSDCGDD
jgi:hypothetical protein